MPGQVLRLILFVQTMCEVFIGYSMQHITFRSYLAMNAKMGGNDVDRTHRDPF